MLKLQLSHPTSGVVDQHSKQDPSGSTSYASAEIRPPSCSVNNCSGNRAENRPQAFATKSAFSPRSLWSSTRRLSGYHRDNKYSSMSPTAALSKPAAIGDEMDRAQDSEKLSMSLLAKKISHETEKVEAYFVKHGLPVPNFDVDSPGDFPQLPEAIARSRREVIHMTQQLRDIMVGPRESVRWMAWDFMGPQSLGIINHFGLAKLVPLEGEISLAELQKLTPLDSVNLARVLRYAMSQNLFCEPRTGVVAHTAASRLLVEDQALQSWVGFNCEDILPASSRVIDALTYDPNATDLTRTGFNFAFDTVDREPMFVTFGKDPQRARRMGQAMTSLTGGEGYETSYLVDGYRDLWTDLDARGGTLVDVGGSHGFVCVDLAKEFRNMRFIVQDTPKTVESAPQPVCPSDEQVSDRISFQGHDFFTEQSVRGADVYFLRWIAHNYATPYAVNILRNLVPALRPGSRVVINDHCLREPGAENPWDEKIMRGMDMVMMTLLNAQERDEDEFRDLFRQADKGFVFKGVTRPKGCRMSIIEAVWKPEEV